MENDETMLCQTLFRMDRHVVALLHATSSSSLIIECVTSILVPLQLRRLQANDNKQIIYLHRIKRHQSPAGLVPTYQFCDTLGGWRIFGSSCDFATELQKRNHYQYINFPAERGAICSYKNHWRVMFPFSGELVENKYHEYLVMPAGPSSLL